MRLLLPLLALLGACTGSTRGPVIDDLQMPQAATLAPSGFFEVAGLASFHDDEDPLAKIRIKVPLVGMSYDYDAPPGLFRGTLQLTVRFAASSPRGPVAYEVSLVDGAGLESAPAKQGVALQ